MNIEECLREIRGKAAILRYVASSATLNPEMLDPEVFTGIWTVCEEIESLTASVTRTLSVDSLADEIKPKRRK
jgi:hypothetical protein